VKTTANLAVPYRTEKFFTSWSTVTCRGGTPLHAALFSVLRAPGLRLPQPAIRYVGIAGYFSGDGTARD
jgi:hypothetical protein